MKCVESTLASITLCTYLRFFRPIILLYFRDVFSIFFYRLSFATFIIVANMLAKAWYSRADNQPTTIIIRHKRVQICVLR